MPYILLLFDQYSHIVGTYTSIYYCIFLYATLSCEISRMSAFLPDERIYVYCCYLFVYFQKMTGSYKYEAVVNKKNGLHSYSNRLQTGVQYSKNRNVMTAAALYVSE